MRATLFTLSYRMEAIILTEIGMLIAKIVMQDKRDNDEELIKQLDWADKIGQLFSTTKGHEHGFFVQDF
ncbi:hypothetical protein AAG906_019452 [Vitis piasezkii]